MVLAIKNAFTLQLSEERRTGGADLRMAKRPVVLIASVPKFTIREV